MRWAARFFVGVASVIVVAGSVGTLSGDPGVASAQTVPVVPDDVRNRVLQEGVARVIVELRLPGAHVAEGHLGAVALARQRGDIHAARTALLNRLKGRLHRVRHQFATVPLVAVEIGPDAMAELEASPHVRRVMQDRLRHPLLAQSAPLIEADQMWALGYDGAGVTVAIVDTGVQSSHPFFGGRVIEEACYSSTNAGISASLCPSGQESQTGLGAGVNCSTTAVSSGCFHGTHVAGIAAGNGATAGQAFSGIAKGASIMAVQVFSKFTRDADCGGLNTAPCILAYTSDIIAGLERVYAVRALHNFSSVNLSLGGPRFSSPCDGEPEKPIIDTLRSVGIATVIASGNDSSTSTVSSPGCISSAVSVGSTTKTDVVSSFSNVASFMSLFAPGSSIRSSVIDGFGTASGTSMATPHVTGAFALLKEASPGATVDQMLNALKTTGLPVADTRPNGTVTRPRVRIADALAALVPSTPSVTSMSPNTGLPGQSFSAVTIAGGSFQSGATVGLGAGITVGSVTVTSAAQITLNITIAASAVPGARVVTVTNPGGLSGSLTNGFTVGTSVDLVESSLTNPPSTVAVGGSFSVTDTAVNQGATGAGAATTRYYLSATTSKGASAILLTGSRSVLALGAGGTSTGTVTVTVPAATTVGAYYLIACADDLNAVAESNETNNCLASTSQIQVGASGKPDLVTTSLSAPPASAQLNDAFTLTDTVTNQGSSAAAASLTRFYLSKGTVRASNDTILKGARSVPALAVGATSTGSTSLSVSASTPLGVYYVLACADDQFGVSEGNEANNCRASTTTVTVTAPDLTEGNVGVSPASVAVGGSVAITDTVTNAGTGAAAASWTRYFLSADQVKDAGDVSVGVRAVPALLPTASSTGTVTVTLPATIAAGTYYVFACADVNQSLYESVETNNCARAALALSVGVAGPSGVPDLVVSAVSNPPAPLVSGTTFSVTDTTTNQGTLGAVTTTTRYYLGTTAVKDASATLLTGSRAVIGLAAGGTSSGSTPVTVPTTVAAGTYYLIACSDDLNVVAEGNEANNCAASTTQVQVTAAAAEIVIDNSQAGTSFTGEWCVSASSGFFGTNSLYSCGAGLDTYRWTPSIPATRLYKVYIWWTAHANRSTAVPISVTHAGGTTTTIFNQQLGASQWVLHGQYMFNAGNGGYVQVTDSGGQAAADAARFVPVP
jgi:subtilisin family serine protease